MLVSWLEFLSAFFNTLEYRKSSANGNADFLSRLPQPATDLDRIGLNSLTCADTVGIYLIQACGFTPIEPYTPGMGLGGLVPPAPSPFDTISPLPCTADDFGDFHRHRLRMENSDSAPTSESLVAPIVAQNTAGNALKPSPRPPL